MSKILISILCLIIFTSCDVFTTREPESPTVTGIGYQSAVSPDILFSNFSKSINSKSVDNYMSSFADDAYISDEFVFEPTAEARSVYNFMSDWNIDLEEQYFFNFSQINKENNVVLQLLNEQWNSVGENHRSYQYDYLIIITNNEDNNESVYEGTLIFEIKTDNRNEWVIVKWNDIKKDDKKSWSDLKGEYV